MVFLYMKVRIKQAIGALLYNRKQRKGQSYGNIYSSLQSAYCYFSHNFTVWRITSKSKTKVRTMYAGAILLLFLSFPICAYVDIQSDLPTAIRFDAILIFAIFAQP